MSARFCLRHHYRRSVATIAERIRAALDQDGPLDDDDLAVRLGVRRQSINPVAARLAVLGQIRRYPGPKGKLTNALLDDARIPVNISTPNPAAVDGTDLLSEDEVKAAVRDHLEALGYTVTVAWGRTRGIDLDARHPVEPPVIVEAKGAVASDQQQGNYFLGALGELVQRMGDPTAVYAIALPDNRRYRGLVSRLPALARQRLGLRVYWVSRGSTGPEVEVDGA